MRADAAAKDQPSKSNNRSSRFRFHPFLEHSLGQNKISTIKTFTSCISYLEIYISFFKILDKEIAACELPYQRNKEKMGNDVFFAEVAV